MTRAMNPCEQFIYNRTHELARLPRDPIDYGTRLSAFFHELASAAATALGESASPLQLIDFGNVYHARLAQIRHGLPHELRLTPYVTEPMPAREEIPAAPAAEQVQLKLEPLDDVSLTPAQMKAARCTLKRRQSDVAKALKVSQGNVSRWEFGLLEPTPEQMVKLRRFLQLPPTGFPPERMTDNPGLVRPTKQERIQLNQLTFQEGP